MTVMESHATLGQLATGHPGRARVFEHFGLPYCCHGSKPLDQACADKGLDVEEVLDQLADGDFWDAETRPTNWAEATMTALVDHIATTDHAALGAKLPLLAELSATAAKLHGHRYPKLWQLCRLLVDLTAELGSHTFREEQILFPQLKWLEAGREGPGLSGSHLTNALAVMEREHQDFGEVLTWIRTLMDNYTAPPGACLAYRELLNQLSKLEASRHQQIHKENNILFPKARQIATALAAESQRANGVYTSRC